MKWVEVCEFRIDLVYDVLCLFEKALSTTQVKRDYLNSDLSAGCRTSSEKEMCFPFGKWQNVEASDYVNILARISKNIV